jgi:hypothetical protein
MNLRHHLPFDGAVMAHDGCAATIRGLRIVMVAARAPPSQSKDRHRWRDGAKKRGDRCSSAPCRRHRAKLS